MIRVLRGNMSIRHCNIISPAMGQSRAFGSDILRVIIEIGGVALYAAIISAIDLTEIMILDDDRPLPEIPNRKYRYKATAGRNC